MHLKTILLFVCLFSNHRGLRAQATVIDFKTLRSQFDKPNDTSYVVIFFASWCSPCLKELPDFLAFAAQHKGEKTRFLFVSLDFKKAYEKSLKPVLEQYQLPQPVFLLYEPDAAAWINAIDSDWSGAIPATLIANRAHHYWTLHEGIMSPKMLKKTLKASKKRRVLRNLF